MVMNKTHKNGIKETGRAMIRQQTLKPYSVDLMQSTSLYQSIRIIQ